MHDPWTDRLSEYIDGALGPDVARSVEQHLEECTACRVTLEELRTVIARARAVEDSAPERDLWDGIAARISARPTQTAPDVVPLRVRTGRRFSFTLPELAAAALILVALSAAAVWWLGSHAAGPAPTMGAIVHTAGDAGVNGQLVTLATAENRFDDDIAALERTLDDARELLDPATIDVIERSLEVIDQAITDARVALAADPGNPHLTRQLDNTMRTKLEVLRRAHRVQRVGT